MTYDTIDGLILDGRVPVWIHQVDSPGGSQIQPNASGAQANEEDFAARIRLQGLHSAGAVVALHRTVKTIIADLSRFEGVLDSGAGASHVS